MDRDDVSGLRRLLLALVLIGTLGLSTELALLEHWDEWLQWIPFVGLGAGLAATAAVWLRPSPATVRAFRATMGLFLALGALGVWLHYRGNALFEVEMDPDAAGWGLFRTALFGATPILAPGALAQTGLIGLVATFRHPALRAHDRPSSGDER